MADKPRVRCDDGDCTQPVVLWWSVRESARRPWVPRAYCYEHGAQLFTIERIYYGHCNTTNLSVA